MSSIRSFSVSQVQNLPSTAAGEGRKVGSSPPQAASAAQASSGSTRPVSASTQ